MSGVQRSSNWYPNRRQWFVIWSAYALWACFGPGFSDPWIGEMLRWRHDFELYELLPSIEARFVVGAVLLVWRLNRKEEAHG
jgi:hypothetical protein